MVKGFRGKQGWQKKGDFAGLTDEDLLADYRWLVSEEGRRWVDRVAGERGSTLLLLKRLRRVLSASRARLVVEQCQLRRKAREKFPWADRMFFTRKGLEQATDAWVASYKAGRFVPGQRVADLCCGIGGDLQALCRRGPVQAVDRDPVAVVLARANTEAINPGGNPSLEVEVCCRDLGGIEHQLEALSAWHIDPDRRPAGRRSVQPMVSSPPWEVIEGLWNVCAHAAVKLAPAAELSPAWQAKAELEWISFRGRCREQVAWFGYLAGSPGKRVATVLGDTPEPCQVSAERLVGDPKVVPPLASQMGPIVCDPDPAVLAAGLLGELCRQFGLETLAPSGGYLTGKEIPTSGLVQSYSLEDVVPLDINKLRQYLRARNVGEVIVKKRSVKIDAEELRAKLKLRGNNTIHLIIAEFKRHFYALVVRPT